MSTVTLDCLSATKIVRFSVGDNLSRARERLSFMSFGPFTLAEAFEAAHAYAWFSATEDTSELAAHARSDDGLRLWRAAITYVRNWPPSFLLPAASGAAESARNLTVEEGLKVFIAFVEAYNRLSVTETFLFAIYVAGDPAAWPDWVLCLEEARD